MNGLILLVVGLAILVAVSLCGKRRPPPPKNDGTVDYMVFYDDQ